MRALHGFITSPCDPVDKNAVLRLKLLGIAFNVVNHGMSFEKRGLK